MQRYKLISTHHLDKITRHSIIYQSKSSIFTFKNHFLERKSLDISNRPLCLNIALFGDFLQVFEVNSAFEYHIVKADKVDENETPKLSGSLQTNAWDYIWIIASNKHCHFSKS